MKIVRLQHPPTLQKQDFPPLSIALGFFDGVHRGHQKVIRKAVETAQLQDLKSAVMTFDPHPSVVLSQSNKPIQYITPLEDKVHWIEELGVDYLFIVRFTSALASLEAGEFVKQYLLHLNIQHVTAGFDFTYGRKGKGTMETLLNHGEGYFKVDTISKMEQDGEKVSSTLIRQQLQQGEMMQAHDLLGRFYTTTGTVIHGEKRGRLLGFPTANISSSRPYIIPKTGVYAVRLGMNKRWHNGVCNVGYKPTFHDPGRTSLSIEVHLLDFNDTIYGEEVTVEWRNRIRNERKFSGLEELKAQIEEDKYTAANLLNADVD